MGEVGETIPDVPISNDHGIASLTNGDVQNGIEKITGQLPIEKMEVDEDESQLSSSENGNSVKFSLLDAEKLKPEDNQDDSHSSVDISATNNSNNNNINNNNNNNSDNDRNDENSNHMASIDSQEDLSQNSDLKSQENGSTVDENSTQHNDDEETTQDTLKSSSVPDDDISQIKTDQINEGDNTTQDSNTDKENAKSSAKSEEKSESEEANANIAEDSTKMEVDGDNNTVPKSKEINPLDTLVHDEAKKIDESSTTSSAINCSNRNGSTDNDLDKNKIDNNSITIIESDEDDEDPFKDIPEKVAPSSTANSNGKVTKNDEEDAVLIDDSDVEEKDDNTTINITTISSTPTNSTATSIAAAVINKSSTPQPLEVKKVEDDDDDDDDCVVIDDDDDEDDDPLGSQDQSDANESSPSLSGRMSSGRSRKAIMSRDELDLTDDEPPYKRQKTSGMNALNSLQSGTITITPRPPEMSDEPRSFQQSFMQQSGVNNNSRAVLTPLPNNQVPKLAPVSNVLNANANLLPALTDDMFVLEAPSFIVPYIYEKPPETTLRAVVEKLQSDFNFDDIKEDEDDLLKDLSALKAKPSTSSLTQSSSESKSKRKRRRKDGDDDEWNEFDETISSDEEGSSVNSDGVPKVIISKAETDDLNIIKAAIAAPDKIVSKDPLAGIESAQSSDKKPENYFESPLGKFFIDIGINLVQEYVQADLLKIQKRKQRKSSAEEDIKTYELAINALQKNLDASKKRNEPFKFSMKRCEFCTFKTESALGMANHYETPHVDKNIYKCNFCPFEVRQTTHEILFHMEAVHNIKGRLERPLLLNQCPNCPFEDNGKSKFGRHQPVCAKKFRPEINLCPPPDWEAPAKIPRIKPRHGLVGTATAYQAMAAQAAAQKAALVSLQAQQQANRNLITAKAAMTQRNRNNLPTNNVISNRNQVRNTGSMGMSGRNQMQNVKNLPNNYQIQGGHLVQVPGTSMAILPNSFNFQSTQNQKRMGQQPSISITPLPRQPNNSLSPSSSGFAAGAPPPGAKPGIKPGQSPSKTSFVICEICDGYIKDLEQLRNHMQWMHKVKIHPKMIYNRPPLNCQKCQFRFFTDQGLERHLLGSHGLVTSSMQEAANKGKDAGRCPVCGRMYQWKLLNHVSRDHNMTLKPAHLSYKCTVCTATFGMYKQFENHVYTAHSTVAKKAMDVKNKTIPIGSSGNNGSNSPNIQKGAGNSNDPLLKPLRINDEITIIPQPAKKN